MRKRGYSDYGDGPSFPSLESNYRTNTARHNPYAEKEGTWRGDLEGPLPAGGGGGGGGVGSSVCGSFSFYSADNVTTGGRHLTLFPSQLFWMQQKKIGKLRFGFIETHSVAKGFRFLRHILGKTKPGTF